MSGVVVLGGYGTFGAQVCRELARRGLTVTVAGRDHARAEAIARQLGPPHRARQADASNLRSCRDAVAWQSVAVCCAGPFAVIGDTLLEACLEEGCHYADISDDRFYVARVRARDASFRARGIAAVFGCSSLPGLSGALALRARAAWTDPPTSARVTLFIGNDNPKGEAAVRAVVDGLGQPIAAPQGVLHGFRRREVVELPAPFGPRAVYDLDSPEYDLFPPLLSLSRVSVKVGFEMRLATASFAALAWLPWRPGRRTASLLVGLGRLAGRRGSSGGAVMVELTWGARGRRAALVARREGQRMAALPCVLVTTALATGTARAQGALAPYELLGAEPLLSAIAAEGYTLVEESWP